MDRSGESRILTPDQRLRVFVSSTLRELAAERSAAREAVQSLRLTPVMLESAARTHPLRETYVDYLEQSHVFVGIYGESYGSIVPELSVSMIEDQFVLAVGKPRLLYIKSDCPSRDPRLVSLLESFKTEAGVSYTYFGGPDDLSRLIKNDLIVLLTEHFLEPSRYPGSPASEVAATNVPAPASILVGRERELREVQKLLGTARLLTLTGTGGTGKTRLALEALRQVEGSGAESRWVVELAGLQEPELVPSVIAQTVGLIAQPGRPTTEVLAEVIADRSALLMIDNCEHVIDPVSELVSDLLMACPNLRVLATSREPLRVRAEVVYPLEPLPVTLEGPEGTALDGDAMRMFEARAADIVPGFRLDESNRDAVRTICSALDGLPLAIELAASRLRLLSVQQLADRLDDRFALLAHGPRDLPDRQRTLLATIDWSFDLLLEPEKRFFTSLSVFRGGFEFDAIEKVTGQPELEILDLLDGLVTKSLVEVDRAAHHLRYDLLETLREYCRRRLTREELDDLRRRHLAWAVELAAFAEPRLRGPEAGSWLARLDRERDNLRAALKFSMQEGRHQTALALAGDLGWFWYRQGYVTEARLWLQRALDAAPPDPTKERATALLGLAGISYLSGDLPDAGRFATEAIAVGSSAGHTPSQVRAMLYSAYFHGMLGRLQEGETLVRSGVEMARQAHLRDLEAEAFSALGLLARVQGRPDESERLFLEGAAIAKEVGYRWHEGSSLWLAAKVALDRGDAAIAEKRIRDALNLIVSERDRTSTLVGLHTMAAALAGAGAPEEGARLIGAVAAAGEKIGFFPERMDPLDGAMTVERVRSALDEDAYDRAYEEGRFLSVRAALELAGVDAQLIRDLPSWGSG
jgi:predicted ATPase